MPHPETIQFEADHITAIRPLTRVIVEVPPQGDASVLGATIAGTLAATALAEHPQTDTPPFDFEYLDQCLRQTPNSLGSFQIQQFETESRSNIQQRTRLLAHKSLVTAGLLFAGKANAGHGFFGDRIHTIPLFPSDPLGEAYGDLLRPSQKGQPAMAVARTALVGNGSLSFCFDDHELPGLPAALASLPTIRGQQIRLVETQHPVLHGLQAMRKGTAQAPLPPIIDLANAVDAWQAYAQEYGLFARPAVTTQESVAFEIGDVPKRIGQAALGVRVMVNGRTADLQAMGFMSTRTSRQITRFRFAAKDKRSGQPLSELDSASLVAHPMARSPGIVYLDNQQHDAIPPERTESVAILNGATELLRTVLLGR